jgi:hypothetical protein
MKTVYDQSHPSTRWISLLVTACAYRGVATGKEELYSHFCFTSASISSHAKSPMARPLHFPLYCYSSSSKVPPSTSATICKRPLPVPILSHNNPVHDPHSISGRSISILSSHILLGLPSYLFPSGLPIKNLYAPLLFPIRVKCPTHLSLLDLTTRIIFCGEHAS